MKSFEAYVERIEAYDAAIIAAGDVPWHCDPERLFKVRTRLGLPEDTPPDDVRRALFERSHKPVRAPQAWA